MKNHDVVIIGAGPAGISAAIQLKRYDIEPVLLEKNEACGLLKEAILIENYPGFPRGITGLQLADIFDQQLKRSGIEIQFEKVLHLDHHNGYFIIKTEKRIFSSLIVIIASGTEPREADLEIPKGIDDRIYYGIRHLARVKNKKTAIIGAGDIAFDYALNLSKNNEVIILNRRRLTKCLPLLRRRVQENKKISYLENVTLQKIKTHSDGLILELYNSEVKREHSIFAYYLIFAIGRIPCLDFISDNVKENIDKLKKMGILYMIGDVKNANYRQTAIAAGDGIMCAMKISETLRKKAQ